MKLKKIEVNILECILYAVVPRRKQPSSKNTDGQPHADHAYRNATATFPIRPNKGAHTKHLHTRFAVDI